METSSLIELEKYLNDEKTKEVKCFCDLSEEENLPEYIRELKFLDGLVVHPTCDLNKLPRTIDSDLYIGGCGNYTINIITPNLKGLPTYIQGGLHIQSALERFEGAESTEIRDWLHFSLKRIKSFRNMPHFIKEENKISTRVSVFGTDYLNILLKKIWSEYPEFEHDKNICCIIQEICERDFQETFLAEL